jgi:hypothetical protein
MRFATWIRSTASRPIFAGKFNRCAQISKTEFGRMRAETASGFEKMRSEMASELGRMRADMADEIGKVRIEMISEFGAVRTEMAKGFGLVAREFGKVRTEAEAIKADLLRWVLLTLVSSAAISAAVAPLVKGFMN